jgi:class 3 adenylate cyclase
MNTTGVKRKLTAILSADVKGYSRLMGEDDVGTVQTLKDYRQIMAALIDAHRGRVVDSTGDNLLAEFASVVDATQCATKIQEELKGRNAQLPENRRMEFRIGINLGDVIEDGDSIYGDGVNIAARVEGLAQAGGICISGSVYDQVKNKFPLDFEYSGDQTVKNISEPVRVYRVLRPDEGTPLRSRPKKPFVLPRVLRKTRWPLLVNISITCLVMIFGMPFVNTLNINLLSKIWQCRLTLLPNTKKVTVVTIGADEHKKMNLAKGQNSPPPFLADPKIWRKYHPTVIKRLKEMEADVVGFDFWFSPAYDEPTQQATQKFVDGLKWSHIKNFPIVVGQAQNLQEPEIYNEVDWGFISLYRDLSWIDDVLYLYAWDKMNLSGIRVEKPSFFIQVLSKKLRLTPTIDGNAVRLIGKPIPRRLWLAFAETPFKKVSYHELYNGWADKALFSGKIVLIGMAGNDTDYFQTPYSPIDFTPEDKDDANGMPGVFLYAHAINQIMNGYYHTEINDEWFGFRGGKWFSIVKLESLIILLLETILTCLALYGSWFLVRKKDSVKLSCYVMSLFAIALIIGLAITPVLFGLANFLLAAVVFIPLTARQKPAAIM